MLKYWDGDKFEQILSLAGHHAEVWALGISSAGDTVITGVEVSRLKNFNFFSRGVFLIGFVKL